MDNKFTRTEFLSNVCYALTAILIKTQFGEFKSTENGFEIRKKIEGFNVDKLDLDIEHSILDAELVKAINDVLEVSSNNNYSAIKNTIKNSLFNLLKLNKRITASSYVNYFDSLSEALMVIYNRNQDEEKSLSKVKLNFSKIPDYKFDGREFGFDNIINSSVIDNLNVYYTETATILSKEQKDDKKLVSIIGEMFGNFEKQFSSYKNKESFLLFEALDFYLKYIAKNDNDQKLYTKKEIVNLLK